MLSCLFLLTTQAHSKAKEPLDYKYDPYNAEEINELCAGCHGEFGEGGSEGEYPRLAGLPAGYLAEQLLAFRKKDRDSLAMVIYATERELSDTDLWDISRFFADITLMTEMPDIDPDMDSLEKLRLSLRVFRVPPIEGDTKKGRDIYARSCAKCHGNKGQGRGEMPMLAGQYTEYLRLQIKFLQTGERISKRMEKYIIPLTPEDIEALLAYLSVVDQ